MNFHFWQRRASFGKGEAINPWFSEWRKHKLVIWGQRFGLFYFIKVSFSVLACQDGHEGVTPSSCSSPGPVVNWDTTPTRCNIGEKFYWDAVNTSLTSKKHSLCECLVQGVSIPTHSVRILPTWETCPVALSSQKCQRGRNVSGCLLTYEEEKQITSQFSKQPSFSKLTVLTFCERRRQLRCDPSLRNCSLEQCSLSSEKVSRKDWTTSCKQLDIWQLIHYCWEVSLVRDREPHGGSAAWSSSWGKSQKFPVIPELLWTVLVTNYFPLDKHVGGKICHQCHQEVHYPWAQLASSAQLNICIRSLTEFFEFKIILFNIFSRVCKKVLFSCMLWYCPVACCPTYYAKKYVG